MSEFNYSDWATCGVGSSVTWEEDSSSRRRLTDLPESLTAEQLEMMTRQLPPEQREMILKREMSHRMLTEHRATLVERHPDRLVVEIRTTIQGRPEGFALQEVLPAVPPPPEPHSQVILHREWEDENGGGSTTVTKQSWDDLFKDAPTTEGEETIDVAGRPMACRWTEKAAQTPPGLLQIRTWRNDDLPGGCARFSLRLEGPVTSQTILTKVVSFDRKAGP